MRCMFVRRNFVVAGLFVLCAQASQLNAEWYIDRSNRDYNPGFGDFPPKDIDWQLQNRNRLRPPVQVIVVPHDYREPVENINRKKLSYSNDFSARQPEYRSIVLQSSDYQTLDYRGKDYTLGAAPAADRGIDSDVFSVRTLDYPATLPIRDRGKVFPRMNQKSDTNPWSRRGIWGGDSATYGNTGPSEWLAPEKRSLSKNWAEIMNAPARIGGVPGGWEAPTVNLPDPIKAGEEFDYVKEGLPTQINNIRWADRFYN